MNKKQKTLLFSLPAILIIGLLAFLSLPYSFTPFSTWLENLLSQKDPCVCLCPWWLFIIVLVFSCSLILRVFSSFKKESKLGYWAILIILGIATYIFHLLIHRFYTQKQIFEASIFCQWFWLIDLVIVFIFGLFKTHKGR